MKSRGLKAISKINPARLWRAVQRRMPVIIGVMVSAGAITYFALTTITPEFTAEARVTLAGKTLKQKTLPAKEIAEQVKSFYNSDFLQNVIRTLNLQTHPEFAKEKVDGKILEQRVSASLDVSAINDTGLLSIRFMSTDPNLAADAANAFSNAYLVQTGEKHKQIQVRLLSRAVVPLAPDFPKKGPVAMFIMSLFGLGMLGYIFIREVRNSPALDEERLDREHHHTAEEAGQATEKQTPIIRRRQAGPAFRGIYPWLPEASLDELVEQLKSLKKDRKPFRILVTAENSNIHTNREVLAISRAFAEEKLPALLLDTEHGRQSLTTELGLQAPKGFTEVVEDPSLLGKIIHTDSNSSLHIVASGAESNMEYTDQEKTNLVKIFHAWSAVYEVVIVCCSNHSSFDLFKNLGGEFEACVFVQDDNPVRESSVSKKISEKGTGIDMIYYRQQDPHQKTDNVIAISSGTAS